MKSFEIVIDEEKTGALHQIRSTLAEYDFKIVKSDEHNIDEYFNN
jgi:hypothetical protein